MAICGLLQSIYVDEISQKDRPDAANNSLQHVAQHNIVLPENLRRVAVKESSASRAVAQ